ncbi:MAG: hypothetical protein KDC38_02020 [Planctomycetes bacterium]|nr:hypothetical protein [Planctomycetota bacterium]
MDRIVVVLVILVGILGGSRVSQAQGSFVNWETPHVHPLDRSGDLLLAVNTADDRLEIFDVASATAVPLDSVPVGLDPVSVRAFGAQAWVVNHVSDSISVIDLPTRTLVATLRTGDEPCDVAFAGTTPKAFVTCSQVNQVWVFDPSDLAAAPTVLDIEGEDPRALAVSPDGSTVYAAIFESGNRSTVLGGGLAVSATLSFPPNAVSSPLGPYGGVNPPPNSGTSFDPPIAAGLPTPPAVGLIVKQDEFGLWMDDNGGDWTELVTGPLAGESGRLPGWHLVDHDVAVIDADTLSVGYLTGLMNICMAIAVHPIDGTVSVVGTDATNEIRFEPNLTGTFVRSLIALVDSTGSATSVIDLNDHLDYTVGTVPQAMRDLSIGDPRQIVWNGSGTRAYVAGMGSNNMVIVDSAGARAGSASTVELGTGPTGLALDEARDRLYALDKFSATITVVDLSSEVAIDTVAFYDPTPVAIREGRFALYDTHSTSGLGQASCGSCHVDARMDRLGWDLGDPSGSMSIMDQNCLSVPGVAACQDWHPMKGPMSTQTLQDIIGKEPHHWRGDRDGIEEFNPAFEGLLGDDQQLTPTEMQQFEDFLATIHFPPNPHRNVDNSLPTSLPLTGHHTTGRFAPAGTPLPSGNAVTGLADYRTDNLDGIFQCVTCHTLPTGAGSNYEIVGFGIQPVPEGPNGEKHLMVVSVDGSTNVTIKVPQLRNIHEKTGFDTTQLANTAGFGYLHDGSVDSIERFLSEPAFSVVSDQQVANLTAFMLAFAGSDLPMGSPSTPLEPPGVASQDTHAAVGRQITFDATNWDDAGLVAELATLTGLAGAFEVSLVAHGRRQGLARGFRYNGSGNWQSDRAAEIVTTLDLRSGTQTDGAMTFTVVPLGTQTRIGIDRDEDGFFDRDELDTCSDPADPAIVPGAGCGTTFVRGDCNDDGGLDISDPVSLLGILFSGAGLAPCDDACDSNDDGGINVADAVHMLAFQFSMGPAPTDPYPGCGQDPTLDGLTCDTFSSCP